MLTRPRGATAQAFLPECFQKTKIRKNKIVLRHTHRQRHRHKHTHTHTLTYMEGGTCKGNTKSITVRVVTQYCPGLALRHLKYHAILRWISSSLMSKLAVMAITGLYTIFNTGCALLNQLGLLFELEVSETEINWLPSRLQCRLLKPSPFCYGQVKNIIQLTFCFSLSQKETLIGDITLSTQK